MTSRRGSAQEDNGHRRRGKEEDADSALPTCRPTPSDMGGRVDLSGLSHLSQQLVSSGFISRPLPDNAFSGSLDGQEAVMKCLWSLLSSRQVGGHFTGGNRGPC